MTKTTATIGPSQELFIDSAIVHLAGLRIGDRVNVEVHAGGQITLTPIRPEFPEDDISSLIEGAIKNYATSAQRTEG